MTRRLPRSSRTGGACAPNVVASQIATHAPYGGVVPEVASRQHVATIVPGASNARSPTRASRSRDLDAIAVTAGPGLVGALLVGVETAKALAFALGKPLVGVNHLAGHLAAAFLEHPRGAARRRRIRTWRCWCRAGTRR